MMLVFCTTRSGTDVTYNFSLCSIKELVRKFKSYIMLQDAVCYLILVLKLNSSIEILVLKGTVFPFLPAKARH